MAILSLSWRESQNQWYECYALYENEFLKVNWKPTANCWKWHLKCSTGSVNVQTGLDIYPDDTQVESSELERILHTSIWKHSKEIW